MKDRVTYTISADTIKALRSASEVTMIPQARIVERAILTELDRMRQPGGPLAEAKEAPPWTLNEDADKTPNE